MALASAAPGWLHAAPVPPDAALAAFVAAGGSPQDLCSGAPSHDEDHEHSDCSLCRISGTDGLAPATVIREPLPLPDVALALGLSDIDDAHLRRHPAWSGRAPPVA
jgi:hypothetical protein